MPFLLFPPLSRRMVQMAESSPYMVQFSLLKIAEIMVLQSGKNHHFAEL